MSSKSIRQLIAELEKQGCTATMSKSGHWRISRPGYPDKVTVPATPSDRRSELNARAKLRRYLKLNV